MGFSPGGFKDRSGSSYHLELKAGPRAVIWDNFETTKVLDLSWDEFVKMTTQAETLVMLDEVNRKMSMYCGRPKDADA